MVFFIPWRVVAEESGAAHFGFGGAMLLDRRVQYLRGDGGGGCCTSAFRTMAACLRR
jgi:hypothetical protein